MSGDGERSEEELARTATAPGSSSAPATPADQLGDSLGRYRLERELGAGGMGVVHAAFDPDLERRVALKVLRNAGSAEARQRLLREARALARVAHPNVVIVHEVGSANGRDYVAMELIEGETLADWLKAAPRSPREIVAAFTAAARGLAAAHAAGLVHRDFKPHNVLRRKDGRIVVTDFGLARGIEVAIELETTLPIAEAKAAATASTTPSSLSGLTETGSVLGTPAYMAPEQWSGDSVGPAADQFAFCVALWEALAGERPFRGATLEALQAAVRRGPAELDDSKIPRRLRAALRRGLDPDPKRRWPSMDALIVALGRMERPRGVLLMIASSAVVASAIVYTVVSSDDAPAVATPTCEAPVLDPANVWTPALANDLRVKTSPAVMRRFDALFAGWQAARDVACGLDTPMRARRLACLDGVIARLDAVREASVYQHAPTLDQVSRVLVDPGVCNVDDPPRLPAKLSKAAAGAFALSFVAPDAELDVEAAAKAETAAGNDPCARAYVKLARVYGGDNAAAEAVEEALQLADACGDDRARADALVASVAMRLSLFLDPKLEKALAAAEGAVRKVAQPDLVAHLDLVKATIAAVNGKFDEQLKLAESSIRGFGELRPVARLEAVETKVRALHSRRQRGDLEAARAELARWRAEADRLERPRIAATFDALDVAAQWDLGDETGAAARYADLYARWESHRKKPLEGGVTITGTVVDATGAPVAGATVVAGEVIIADSVSPAYLATVDSIRLATTDARGIYRLEHVEPDAIIIAQHDALRSRVRAVKDKDRLVLEPTTRISGRVIDPEPHRLTVFAIPADRNRSPMYQMVAPIGADGSFTIDRVPIGRLRIGAAHHSGLGAQSVVLQDITVGPKGASGLEVRRAQGRKLRVIVRSQVNVPLTGAQVFVVAGTVSIKAVKDIETVLRSPGVAIEVARPLTGETPPELGRLVPGDLVATFQTAPTGAATACALGVTGDFADPGFRDYLKQHMDEVEVRCVPVAADAKVATVEVPPLKRID